VATLEKMAEFLQRVKSQPRLYTDDPHKISSSKS
jgi:hypothetical protein